MMLGPRRSICRCLMLRRFEIIAPRMSGMARCRLTLSFVVGDAAKTLFCLFGVTATSGLKSRLFVERDQKFPAMLG